MKPYGTDKTSEPHNSMEVSDITFENAMDQLDQTVRALEAGGITLGEMTTLYETGIQLAKLCDNMLKATKLKIEQLTEAHEERFESQPVED